MPDTKIDKALLALRLVKTGRNMLDIVDYVCNNFSDLTTGQFLALDAVVRAHPEGLHIKAIADHAFRPIDSTRRVQEMIAAEYRYVTRRPDPENRSYKIIESTDLGRAHHHALMGEIRRIAEAGFAGLSTEEVETLWRITGQLNT